MATDGNEAADEPWSEHTVVEAEELSSYLAPGGDWEDGKTRVTSYLIRPNHGTIDYESFIEFLGRQFMYFVMPKDEVESHQRPMHRAMKLSDPKDDTIRDGVWGELVLFTLVDGLMDIPIMSHKLAWKQNPSDQIKGSDGLFIGEFRGDLSVGIGEAKVYTDLGAGVEEALESTNRFHEGGSQIRNQHELTVASSNPSENLSSDKIELLSSLFTRNGPDYKLIHPIFVGYQDDELQNLQTRPMDDDELEEEIQNRIEDTGLMEEVKDSLNSYSHLQTEWLVFFFLPFENKDRFLENLKSEIYPYLPNHQ